MDRIAVLEEFVSKQPDDPFPRYGLAMEYMGQGRLEEAQAQFDVLLEEFPDYVATYLMSGGNLVALGRDEDAARVYRNGIEVSAAKGDSHAKSELEAALADLDKTE